MEQSNLIQIPIEFEPLFKTTWREAAVYGGRFSLKSHSVARYLLIRAMQAKVRVACFREYQNSITESSHQLLHDLINKYNLTGFRVTNNSIINTKTGSDFIFKGFHGNEQSIKSIEGIDIAWVEEAQMVSEKSLEILTPTVRKDGSQIIYTYNRDELVDPVHTRLVLEGRPNTLVLNVNYLDILKYGWIPDVILAEIEDDKKSRPELYKHKWLGEPSTNNELLIYRNWVTVDDVPHEARLVRRGQDYGYSVDPSVIVDIYEYNGGYILDEQLYQKGMSNKALADFKAALPEPQTLVVADSAEPKSIDEERSYGLNIIGAVKGPGSQLQGIQYVQAQKISVTRRSRNIIRSVANYKWKKDKNGLILQVPDDSVHEWSNAMDAIRYGFSDLRPGILQTNMLLKQQLDMNRARITQSSTR